MPQSTYFCVRLADGQLRSAAYGVGGNVTFALQEGIELAHGERDALCTNYGITVLGARGQIGLTAEYNSNYSFYIVETVEPHARSLGRIGVSRCFVDEAGVLGCVNVNGTATDALADLLNQLGPIDHMVRTAACAVYRDGQVACASENGPNAVIPLFTNAKEASIVSLGLSNYVGCALLRTGKVSCMGSPALMLRGFADTGDTHTPVEIPGLDHIDEVATSGGTACARRGGQVWCWGEAAGGVAGAAALADSAPMPRCEIDEVATKRDKDAFDAAEKACHDPKRSHDGDDPMCRAMWKAVPPGPVFKPSTTPCDPYGGSSRWAKVHRVDGIEHATAVATNGRITCVLDAGTTMTCWGGGKSDPQSIKFPARALAAEAEVRPGTVVVPRRGLSLDVGDGEVVVTGKSGKRVRHTLDPTLGPATAIAGDAIDVIASPPCTLHADGTVACDPRMKRARLGFPTDPEGNRVSVLYGVGCILRRDGILHCGDKTTRENGAHRMAADLVGAGSIVEQSGWCARYTDGAIRCRSGDKLVVRWPSARALAADDIGMQTCALMANGDVQCADSSATLTIPGLPRVAQISTTTSRSCAVGEDGSVWCWQAVQQGKLAAPPAQIAAVKDAVAVDVGANASCALTKASKLVCWDPANAQVQSVPTKID